MVWARSLHLPGSKSSAVHGLGALFTSVWAEILGGAWFGRGLYICLGQNPRRCMVWARSLHLSGPKSSAVHGLGAVFTLGWAEILGGAWFGRALYTSLIFIDFH